ncbi:MAG TPA: creatininase family protein [Bdellovibrionota bacterium]|jgi:threonine aldolase/creatinine amidohydrolase/Fe(II)-dependent formamide hydrolase-like protein
MTGHRIENLSWKEAEALLEKQPVVVIPVGAGAKEHGLHLPLNNDLLIAEYLSRRVLEALPVVVYPTLSYGFYPAFVEYPGSVSLRKDVFRDLVIDVCRSISRHGPKKFYVLNTGLSTNWSLEPARAELAKLGVQMEYSYLPSMAAEEEKSVEQQEAGTHADEIETSMMLYIAPEVVKMQLAQKDIHTDRKGPFTRDPNNQSGHYSPTGAWGDPTLATREKGALVVEARVKHIVDFLKAFSKKEFFPTPVRDNYLPQKASSGARPPPLATQPDPKAGEFVKKCEWFLGGDPPKSLPVLYRELADYAESQKADTDYYGTGRFLNDFEHEMAGLLGFEAAVFMPSGTMAQQIALRLRCERAGSKEIAFHSTSHLELNEFHAYKELHGLTAHCIGDPATTVYARDISGMKDGIACVLVELPQRRNGGKLPTWKELEELKAAAKKKNTKLHLDGARLWESQPFYGKEYRDICRGFDSVYLSFYKGINAITGAMLLGKSAFIDEARTWLRRHGGNLYHLHPYVVSAKMMLDRKRGRFSLYREKALEVAALAAKSGVSVYPDPPEATMMHLRFSCDLVRARELRNQIAETEKVWIGSPIAREAGSYFELSVGEATLLLPPEKLTAVVNKMGEFA